MKPVRLVIIGAGDRGNVYASYARHHPEKAKVVGVAEPIEARRTAMMTQYSVPESDVFTDWRDLAKRDRFADAAVIATQDTMHEGPAVALANSGYHLLLEKPMAPDKDACTNIVRAVLENDVMFSVGHVLRYTRFTRKLKGIIDSGTIGEVVSIQRLEPVGYWHQAHSFVRGNWRNEKESSFMLLAKSCHDIDWIRYIMSRRCIAVSSFGGLFHFREENRPANAGNRCTECDYEPSCPYSALKIYLGFLDRGVAGWPIHVLVEGEPTRESVMHALRAGPYGRCVYACDNDVVDHQVVNMEFEGGTSASFAMMAFTKARQRETRVFGTKGEIVGNGTIIEVHDFLKDSTETIDTSAEDPSSLSDHGGGDYALIDSFVDAVGEGNRSYILSGPEETLESHLITFAAEQSRRENRVVFL
jgi:predicted dehydrogenase